MFADCIDSLCHSVISLCVLYFCFCFCFSSGRFFRDHYCGQYVYTQQLHMYTYDQVVRYIKLHLRIVYVFGNKNKCVLISSSMCNTSKVQEQKKRTTMFVMLHNICIMRELQELFICMKIHRGVERKNEGSNKNFILSITAPKKAKNLSNSFVHLQHLKET